MTTKPADAAARTKSQTGVQSVEIGLGILAALAEAHTPMLLRDLARAVDMPAAKVHRYLVSLTQAGVVEQFGAGGRYGLGPLSLTLGLSALNQMDVVRLGGRAAVGLRDRIGETAMLALWAAGGPTIVRWEECRRPIAVNVRIGSVLGLLNSATGQVFAAYLPEEVTGTILADEMCGRGPDELGQVLDKVRRHGMSFVRGNQLASINAVSAPVFDPDGQIAAAITVLGPERRFDAGWDVPAAIELKEMAAGVSRELAAARGGGG